MARRSLLLVAAVLLAAIGTGVLFLAVRAAPADPARGTVGVLVPTSTIPPGTALDPAQFESRRVEARLAGQAALVTRADELRGKLATQELPAYAPVARSQVGTTVTGSSSIPLVPDTMTISVEMDDPARVADFLYAGARVAVWVVDPDTRPASARHQVQVVLPEVTVVTTGSTGTIRRSGAGTATGAQGRSSSSIVTLRVTQDQAAQVLLAQAAGQLYFTLLGDTKAAVKSYQGPD